MRVWSGPGACGLGVGQVLCRTQSAVATLKGSERAAPYLLALAAPRSAKSKTRRDAFERTPDDRQTYRPLYVSTAAAADWACGALHYDLGSVADALRHHVSLVRSSASLVQEQCEEWVAMHPHIWVKGTQAAAPSSSGGDGGSAELLPGPGPTPAGATGKAPPSAAQAASGGALEVVGHHMQPKPPPAASSSQAQVRITPCTPLFPLYAQAQSPARAAHTEAPGGSCQAHNLRTISG